MQHAVRLLQEARPQRRQQHASSIAVKKAGLELHFQRPHLPAQGRLRDIEKVRSLRKTSEFGDADKVAQLFQVHGSAADHTSAKACREETSSLVPSLPTVASAGLPGYAFDGWYGLIAPAGTPDATVKKLNQAINKALADPEVRKTFLTGSLEAAAATPEEFARFLGRDLAKYAQIIKTSGIKGD